MARPRDENHSTQQTWTASGAISVELSPKPYTITRLIVNVRASITTTTATWYSDPHDRIISRLNLTGAGNTYFDFSNMRVARHLGRYKNPSCAPRMPTVTADSATAELQQFQYVFHFGVSPIRVNPVTNCPEDNKWDLTGGIPPAQRGNLTIGGSFAANNVMGANVTTVDGDLDFHLFGVQPESDAEDPARWMPRATPNWQTQTITPTATSSAFSTQYNLPSGDYLHSALVFLTNGTNDPRDDEVLNSFEVYNQQQAREVVRYGGTFEGDADDGKAGMAISQIGMHQAPVSENIEENAGVPALTHQFDQGLYWWPAHQYAWPQNGGHPLYGVDLRNVATGDIQFRYGVADATGIAMIVALAKYKLNMLHPANVGA